MESHYNSQNMTLDKLNDTFAKIICLDVPVGYEFGIDYCTWNIGNKFRGIRFVPPGPHYLHCTALISQPVNIKSSKAKTQVNLPTEHSPLPRNGWWCYLKARSTIVYRFNSRTEELNLVHDVDDISRITLAIGRGEFDSYLGRYPLELWSKWNIQTLFITKKIIDKSCLKTVPTFNSVNTNTKNNNPSLNNNDTRQYSKENEKTVQPSNSLYSFLTPTLPPSSSLKGVAPHIITDIHHGRSWSFVNLVKDCMDEYTTYSSIDKGVGVGVNQIYHTNINTSNYLDILSLIAYNSHSNTNTNTNTEDMDENYSIKETAYIYPDNLSPILLDIADNDVCMLLTHLIHQWTNPHTNTNTNTNNITLTDQIGNTKENTINNDNRLQLAILNPVTPLLPLSSPSSSYVLSDLLPLNPLTPLSLSSMALLSTPLLPLLSELQIAFTGMVLDESYECLTQWKDTIYTLFNNHSLNSVFIDDKIDTKNNNNNQNNYLISDNCPNKKLQTKYVNNWCVFFTQLITLLHLQLLNLPTDFFIDPILCGNLIVQSLVAIKPTMDEIKSIFENLSKENLIVSGIDFSSEIITDKKLSSWYQEVFSKNNSVVLDFDGISQYFYLLFAWTSLGHYLEKIGVDILEDNYDYFDDDDPPMIVDELQSDVGGLSF